MVRRALVTGISGQDGAFLAKLLLDKGYEVVGGLRRRSETNLWRLDHFDIRDRVKLVEFELLEQTNIRSTIASIGADEIYNLAAQSFVASSFQLPIYTAQADAIGVACILEAIRESSPDTRFYQASTSELFGQVRETPQNEDTPFYPRSPYSVAKAFAHYLTVNYREAHGLFACSGILFNHESSLRGIEFVTRKITSELAYIKAGREEPLQLGYLNAKRDWGFAGDYVRGMWLMLQQDEADDFVLATGETRSVRQFVECAAAELGFDVVWEGEGLEEVARDSRSGNILVTINPEFYRPAEVNQLIGDPKKAESALQWRPETSFEQLVADMAQSDYDRVCNGVGLY